MEPVIQMNDVTKSYNGTRGVESLSFFVDSGEIIGLLGPNGSGKTTSIRLFTGVLAPDKGSLSVLGLDPSRAGQQVRACCGVLTESAGLYPHMSGYANLKFFGQLFGVDDEKRIQSLLERFGLDDAAGRNVGTYSTGMKKRLGIARALLHRPKLLFLDEPTTGLDPEGARDLLLYIETLNRDEGVTIVLCTHLLKQVQDLCHRFVFLQEGRVLEAGTLSALETKYVKEVQLAVETNVPRHRLQEEGFAVGDGEHQGRLVLSLPNREAAAQAIRAICELGDVYSAESLQRDLESLYFRIRGEQ